MINLSINNFKLEFNHEISVLEACNFIGLYISRFCFHNSLAIAGNCRMCLIELFDQVKPIASCVQPIAQDLDIYTNTVLVKKAKENVLELLLLNHPLDCPVCERGGECELQDHSFLYASTVSRFFFEKRSVENKNFGFFIETVMNRCIHCTRCIRYFEEISNFQLFGTLFRGTSSQVGLFINNFILKSELFGNVIDLCPVGALNSRHYSTSTKRPWELKIISSIDTTDSTGSNIHIHIKNNVITRILPKLNKYINGSFISDKTRFYFDGNINNRLNKHVINSNITKTKFTSYQLMDLLTGFLLDKNAFHTFFVDSNLDLNSLYTIKRLSGIFRNIKIQSVSNNNNYTNFNINFLSNKIIDIDDKKSKTCFIFGTNTRFEAVLLNLKIRRKVLNFDFDVFTLGLNFKNTFSFKVINLERKVLIKFFESKVIFLCKIFTLFKYPCIFISENMITRGWNINILILTLKKIIPTAIIINIKEGSNDSALSFLNIKGLSKSKLLKSSTFCGFNLNENLKLYEYFTFSNKKSFLTRFLFNTHSSDPIFEADIVIPILSSFESENIYLNLEERPQKTDVGLSSLNYKLYTIQNLMSHILFQTSAYLLPREGLNSTINFLKNLENTDELFINELLNSKLKFQSISPIFSFLTLHKLYLFNSKMLITFDVLKNNDKNFYCNKILAKNSLILNECAIKNRLLHSNFM
jgi:NADH-quinone oxidoreductase subunit G